MLRIAVVALAVLWLAPASLEAGEGTSKGAGPVLPRVLRRHGFGHPRRPVRVTFVAPIGAAANRPVVAGTSRPVAPNTLWVFDDPAPLWRVLARAATRRYLERKIPGAAARITIDASDESTRRSIHLHHRAGEGDISVRRDQGAFEGGAWSFAPGADAALIGLLSRTPPHALGASPTKVFQLHAPAPYAHRGPRLFTVEDASTFQEAKQRLGQRYDRIGDWKLPAGFDWARHFLFGVELAPGPQRKRLDWSGARVRDGILAWELGARPEDRPEIPAGSVAVLLGAFRRLDGLRHLRVDFANGTQAELGWRVAEDYHTPQPDAVFLQAIEPNDTNEAVPTRRTVDVYWDGHYLVRPTRGRQYGRIPLALCVRLRKALELVPYPLDAQGRPPAARRVVVRPPPASRALARALEELLAYLDRVHAR